jgi:hypothetical protein
MRQRSLILLLAILLALVTACGGGDGAETESEATDETASISAATQAPESAEPTEEVAAATTAPDPTAEATSPPPTPTLAPTPTDEPTVVPTSEESTPEGDDAPPSSGDGWGASGTGAQSACDHPYFPMRAGSTWTFSVGEDTMMWEITGIVGDMEEATAELRTTIGDVVIEHTWNCSAGAGLASFERAGLGTGQTGVEMTLENETLEGVFLLPADQLVRSR